MRGFSKPSIKKIENIDVKELEQYISEKNIEKLNSIIKQFYSEEMLKPLERYCFNEPFTPSTIPLALTLMRLADEEVAILNMIKVLEMPPIPYHYRQILLPARGLSLPMKEKLRHTISEMSFNHPKDEVRARAMMTHEIFVDCSIGF